MYNGRDPTKPIYVSKPLFLTRSRQTIDLPLPSHLYSPANSLPSLATSTTYLPPPTFTVPMGAILSSAAEMQAEPM